MTSASSPKASIPNAARYDLCYSEGGERLTVRYDLSARYFNDSVGVSQFGSDSFEIHVEFRDLRWLAARLLDCASAIEAATAGETVKLGSTEGESAVPERQTPDV